MNSASRHPLAPVLLLAMIASCGGSSSPPASAPGANALAMTAIDDRLQGAWRLAAYRPELAPDPMFQALLTTQIGALIVRFERGRLLADSPTFHAARAYRIVEAAGPLFTLESPDVGNAVLTTKATISEDGQHIAFQANTDPWRGSGDLVRVP
jgi:hypothetical protein